jgi:hypothetical protein
LEEVPHPTRKTRNKKPVSKSKLGNFNPDEDKNLVKSWLKISCDPITSTGQKKRSHVGEDHEPVQFEESIQPREKFEVPTEPLGHNQD